jgi:YVTN family beta-propeller protein
MRLAAIATLLAAFASAFILAGPTVVARVKTGDKPCVPLAARGSVWVANFGSSTVARVNPKTNKVTRRVRVGTSSVSCCDHGPVATESPVRLGAGGGLTPRLAVASSRLTCTGFVARRRPRSASVT